MSHHSRSPGAKNLSEPLPTRRRTKSMIIKNVAIWIAVLAIRITTPYSVAAEPLEESEYYPLKVGTEWEYKTAEAVLIVKVVAPRDVKGVSTPRLVTLVEGAIESTEFVRITKDAITRVGVRDVASSVPIVLMPLPPKSGESWLVATEIGSSKVAGVCRCNSIDTDVKVPAGDFSAVEVTGTFVVSGNDGNVTTYKQVTWYASGVGMVKTTLDAGEHHVTLELTRFAAAK